MIILIEVIILLGLFTIFAMLLAINPIKTLFNYPKAIQERVKELEEYKNQIPTNENKIASKMIVSIVIVILVSLILKYINGYDTFIEGFGYSLLIWTIVNIYDALVIDIMWFCHSKKVRFKGTEDMDKEYKNYKFHIIESLKGEFIGLVLCILIGLVISII